MVTKPVPIKRAIESGEELNISRRRSRATVLRSSFLQVVDDSAGFEQDITGHSIWPGKQCTPIAMLRVPDGVGLYRPDPIPVHLITKVTPDPGNGIILAETSEGKTLTVSVFEDNGTEYHLAFGDVLEQDGYDTFRVTEPTANDSYVLVPEGGKVYVKDRGTQKLKGISEGTRRSIQEEEPVLDAFHVVLTPIKTIPFGTGDISGQDSGIGSEYAGGLEIAWDTDGLELQILASTARPKNYDRGYWAYGLSTQYGYVHLIAKDSGDYAQSGRYPGLVIGTALNDITETFEEPRGAYKVFRVVDGEAEDIDAAHSSPYYYLTRKGARADGGFERVRFPVASVNICPNDMNEVEVVPNDSDAGDAESPQPPPQTQPPTEVVSPAPINFRVGTIVRVVEVVSAGDLSAAPTTKQSRQSVVSAGNGMFAFSDYEGSLYTREEGAGGVGRFLKASPTSGGPGPQALFAHEYRGSGDRWTEDGRVAPEPGDRVYLEDTSTRFTRGATVESVDVEGGEIKFSPGGLYRGIVSFGSSLEPQGEPLGRRPVTARRNSVAFQPGQDVFAEAPGATSRDRWKLVSLHQSIPGSFYVQVSHTERGHTIYSAETLFRAAPPASGGVAKYPAPGDRVRIRVDPQRGTKAYFLDREHVMQGLNGWYNNRKWVDVPEEVTLWDADLPGGAGPPPVAGRELITGDKVTLHDESTGYQVKFPSMRFQIDDSGLSYTAQVLYADAAELIADNYGDFINFNLVDPASGVRAGSLFRIDNTWDKTYRIWIDGEGPLLEDWTAPALGADEVFDEFPEDDAYVASVTVPEVDAGPMFRACDPGVVDVRVAGVMTALQASGLADVAIGADFISKTVEHVGDGWSEFVFRMYSRDLDPSKVKLVLGPEGGRTQTDVEVADGLMPITYRSVSPSGGESVYGFMPFMNVRGVKTCGAAGDPVVDFGVLDGAPFGSCFVKSITARVKEIDIGNGSYTLNELFGDSSGIFDDWEGAGAGDGVDVLQAARDLGERALRFSTSGWKLSLPLSVILQKTSAGPPEMGKMLYIECRFDHFVEGAPPSVFEQRVMCDSPPERVVRNSPDVSVSYADVDSANVVIKRKLRVETGYNARYRSPVQRWDPDSREWVTFGTTANVEPHLSYRVPASFEPYSPGGPDPDPVLSVWKVDEGVDAAYDARYYLDVPRVTTDPAAYPATDLLRGLSGPGKLDIKRSFHGMPIGADLYNGAYTEDDLSANGGEFVAIYSASIRKSEGSVVVTDDGGDEHEIQGSGTVYEAAPVTKVFAAGDGGGGDPGSSLPSPEARFLVSEITPVSLEKIKLEVEVECTRGEINLVWINLYADAESLAYARSNDPPARRIYTGKSGSVGGKRPTYNGTLTEGNKVALTFEVATRTYTQHGVHLHAFAADSTPENLGDHVAMAFSWPTQAFHKTWLDSQKD
jgi:hypothetical protein